MEKAVDRLARGDYRAAADAARRAKELAPRSSTVREVLGMALYGQERYRDALRELTAYRRMTGRADQNHLIADSHRAVGNPGKAPQLAEEAFRAPIPDESKAEALLVGAAALADLDRPAEALSLVRRFPRRGAVRPFELRLWYVAGDILERAGRVDEAREEFDRIARHDPEAFDVTERLASLRSRRRPRRGSRGTA